MTYAIILIIVLALLGYLVRQYNLPKILAERNESIEARAKAQNERRDDILKRRQFRNEERAKREAARLARRKRP